ncbi:MAG: hypothetical protein R2856_34010 [Caldilineaceae bacterium]
MACASAWINPYVAQKSPMFDHLVKLPDGDTWRWDLWRAGMGLVDFANRRLSLVQRQTEPPDRPGRRLLQDRFRRAHPHRRGLPRRFRP